MRLDLQTVLNDFSQLETFLFFTKNEESKDYCNADNNGQPSSGNTVVTKFFGRSYKII